MAGYGDEKCRKHCLDPGARNGARHKCLTFLLTEMLGSGLCLLCMYLVFLKSNTYEKGPMEQLLHRLLFFSHSSLQHNQRTSDVLTGLERSSSKKPIFTLGQPLP